MGTMQFVSAIEPKAIGVVVDEQGAVALWECQLCPQLAEPKEFSLVGEGSSLENLTESVVTHMISEHRDQLYRWCQDAGLGEHYEAIVGAYEAVPTSEPVAQPAAEPEPEPVKTKVQKLCVCGYQPLNGKDAGIHKRHCASWKNRNAEPKVVEPQPVAEPEVAPVEAEETEPEVVISAEMPTPVGTPVITIDYLNALLASLDSFVRIGDGAQEDERKWRVQVRQEQMKAREFYQAIENAASRIEKAKEAQGLFRTLNEKFWPKDRDEAMGKLIEQLEVAVAILRMDSLWSEGERANETLDREITTELTKLREKARKVNDQGETALLEAIQIKSDAALPKFERLLDGRLRLSKNTGEPVHFLEELVLRINSHISDKKRGEASREQVKAWAIASLLREVGFGDEELPVTIYAPRATVDETQLSITVSKKEAWHGEVTIPVKKWATRLFQIANYVNREWQTAFRKDGTRLSTLAILMSNEKALDLTIQDMEEQDEDVIVGPRDPKNFELPAWLPLDRVEALKNVMPAKRRDVVDDPGPRGGERFDMAYEGREDEFRKEDRDRNRGRRDRKDQKRGRQGRNR